MYVTKIFAALAVCLLTSSLQSKALGQEPELYLIRNDSKDTVLVYRSGEEGRAILTQVAQEGVRPYIHPIAAPDGNGVLTEYGPGHHLHQTGLYWGLKRVNERDYFMNWKESYWKKISVDIVEESGPMVRWQTTYGLLDEKGEVILTEILDWTMQERNGAFILDLVWTGTASIDITFGEFYVGGLFLRMPWKKGDIAEIVNSNGQKDLEAEAQRALWTDLGVQVPGRDDLAHIAMFDHPDNRAFPTPWRVDSQYGVGPSIQILGDWGLEKGTTETIKYRLLMYTGLHDRDYITQTWKEFACKD